MQFLSVIFKQNQHVSLTSEPLDTCSIVQLGVCMRIKCGKAAQVGQKADGGFFFPTGTPDLNFFDTRNELKTINLDPTSPLSYCTPIDAVSSQCWCWSELKPDKTNNGSLCGSVLADNAYNQQVVFNLLDETPRKEEGSEIQQAGRAQSQIPNPGQLSYCSGSCRKLQPGGAGM